MGINNIETGRAGTTGPRTTVDFEFGDFVPRYYPDDVKVSKKREIDGEKDLCEGEYLKDLGGENRKVHATGIVLGKNIFMLDLIAEAGEPMMFRSIQWSGEVLLEKIEIAGPVGWDGAEDSYWFNYTIDGISTGRDERGETNFGIISGGSGGGGGGGGTGGNVM